MTASLATTGSDQPAGFSDRDPIAWITSVVHDLVLETSLAPTADIEDLVIISYVGLLDSPDATALTQSRLLKRSRQQLVIWAWEQGNANKPIETATATP